jgi:DNA-directed RNA polymerase alpha subunit
MDLLKSLLSNASTEELREIKNIISSILSRRDHRSPRIRIGDLYISTQCRNSFMLAGYEYLDELDKLPIEKIKTFRGMGLKSIGEMMDVLSKCGMKFTK